MAMGGMGMRYKILVVDDEADIVKMLQSFLEKRNYEVLTARSGEEALRQAEKGPDLILLDINMPGLDGLGVCERLRRYLTCPIIFLTARIEEQDKVAGFAAGGDDYILKPFSLVELEARLAAHLRREERHGQSVQVKFREGLTIDYLEHAIYYQGEALGLAKKEFAIVALLSQNVGQVFDKERIYEKIWGWDSTGDSSVVAEHIRRIRAKLSAAGCPELIETVWGCGYKWKK